MVDLKGLGERTVTLDCDVLQADGGTRTAAITGGYVALADAFDSCSRSAPIAANPLHGQVAAVSVGIFRGAPVLDLDYAEDSNAETDMNVVMNSGGAFIEVQGTAEGHAFRRHELDRCWTLRRKASRDCMQHSIECPRRPRQRWSIATATPASCASSRAARRLAVRAVQPGELGMAAPEETGATFSRTRCSRRAMPPLSTGPAGTRGRFRTRSGRAGRRGRASIRRAMPARGADDAANNAKLLPSSPACRASSGGRATAACWCSCDGAEDPAPLMAEALGRLHSGCAARQRRLRLRPVFLAARARARPRRELDPAEKNRLSHRGKALRRCASIAGGASR